MLSLSGFFRFPSAFFRPLPFRFRLLSLCFFRSLLPDSASQQLPQCPLSALASRVPPFSPAWFPVPSFPVPVLGFLFVSFHPSRFRSHSRSTGASLLFRFLSSASFPGFSACLPVSFVPFSLLLTTQPSVFLFPFSPFPLTAVLPVRSGFFRPLRFPPTSGLFPCLPSDSGTQPPAFPFSVLLFRITGTPTASGLLFPARPLPLAFAFGSGYLAPGLYPFGFAPSACVCHFRIGLAYNTTISPICQPLFCVYINYYLALCRFVV